jgi:hypothetical protein
MRKYSTILLLILLIISVLVLACRLNSKKSTIHPISPRVKALMQQHTWKPNCPVAIEDLREVHVSYWGFDNKKHVGLIIVNHELAQEVASIFKQLYKHRFPIERIEIIENYQGNDEDSMLANNSSAFNCRKNDTRPNLFSQHSYGRAFDINPFINPYVSSEALIPKQAAKYKNRMINFPGKIDRQSIAYKIFTEYCWDWGGDWNDVQDYHHFEKRANGEKRPRSYSSK